MALIDVPEYYELLRSDTFRRALRDRLVATRSSLPGKGRTAAPDAVPACPCPPTV